jgi:hypothetical protein
MHKKKPVPPVKQASGEKSAQVPKRPTPKTLFDEDSSEHEKPDDNLDLLDGPTIAIGAHDHLSITPAKEYACAKPLSNLVLFFFKLTPYLRHQGCC